MDYECDSGQGWVSLHSELNGDPTASYGAENSSLPHNEASVIQKPSAPRNQTGANDVAFSTEKILN